VNALTALIPPVVLPVRSFTAKGICVYEPVQGLNLNRRSISRLEPEMPVTLRFVQPICTSQEGREQTNILAFQFLGVPSPLCV